MPNGCKVEHDLILDTNEFLPDDLEIGGYLSLYGNKKIKYLPKGLKIKKSLDLCFTNIKELPIDIEIGESLYLIG